MKPIMMCMAAVLVLALGPQQHRFDRFQAVETYEVRPGIVMTPQYSQAGDLCRVVLEKRHVSVKLVDLDAQMSPEEIYSIFDDIVPKKERGPEVQMFSKFSLIDAHTVTTTAKFQNVVLRMSGKTDDTQPHSYVAATVDWKKPECKDLTGLGDK